MDTMDIIRHGTGAVGITTPGGAVTIARIGAGVLRGAGAGAGVPPGAGVLPGTGALRGAGADRTGGTITGPTIVRSPHPEHTDPILRRAIPVPSDPDAIQPEIAQTTATPVATETTPQPVRRLKV